MSAIQKLISINNDSARQLSEWTAYSRMYCEVMLRAHVGYYGGRIISNISMPSFEDFTNKRGTQYDYLNQYYATDYCISPDNKLIRTYSNCASLVSLFLYWGL